jgi:hypothetical protein
MLISNFTQSGTSSIFRFVTVCLRLQCISVKAMETRKLANLWIQYRQPKLEVVFSLPLWIKFLAYFPNVRLCDLLSVCVSVCRPLSLLGNGGSLRREEG